MGQNISLYNLRCVASLEIIVASLAVGENELEHCLIHLFSFGWCLEKHLQRALCLFKTELFIQSHQVITLVTLRQVNIKL